MESSLSKQRRRCVGNTLHMVMDLRVLPAHPVERKSLSRVFLCNISKSPAVPAKQNIREKIWFQERGGLYCCRYGANPFVVFNWGLSMDSVSFLVLFLLALSVFLSSAEDESKHPTSYCPAFYCEKLGWLRFPFNNVTNPECGFCTVNCSEETPQIQLEKGRRYFGVKNISQADTIVIQDEQLQKELKQGTCEFIDNLTSSRSFVSFKPAANLNLLTCSNANVITVLILVQTMLIPVVMTLPSTIIIQIIL